MKANVCQPRSTAPVEEKEALPWGREGPRFLCFLPSIPATLHALTLELPTAASLKFDFLGYLSELRLARMSRECVRKSEDNLVDCFLSLGVQESTQSFSSSSIAVIKHCGQGKV